jgi:palmitoyltransferase
MVWLKIRGVPFLATDEKGGTSLHWASFYGSEFAVHFMLSWITDDSIINK